MNAISEEDRFLSRSLDWLRAWAQYAPKSVAFEDADSRRTYTYGELYFLTCALASKLETDFGVHRGDRITVLSTNELEYVALFFAIQRLGAILVPINYRLAPREIDHILNDSDSKLLVYQSRYAETLKACAHAPKQTWQLDGDKSVSAFLAKQSQAFTAWIGKPLRDQHAWTFDFRGRFDDPCMILYTSGTTGAPKGALITNKMLHWNSANTGLRLNLQQSDVALTFLPFFHTSGWNVLVTPFVHRGAKTILIKKFDAERIMELTEKEGVTIMFGVPTTLEMMVRTAAFPKVNLSKVRYAIVGGEPMSIELIHTWQRKGVAIRQGFGLTEFGPSVFSLNEEDALRKIGSIGFPNFYVEARIVNDRDEDVATNEIGELILKGPVCTPGYWRNSEATASAIKNGWFHTGDLVRKDDEGYFYVAGRKKEMYISGGENVYPVEVERHLSTHPAIREVAVIGVKDKKWGEVGKAFIALKAGETLSEDQVITYCQAGLAKYKVPKHVAFMADLPKGDSGKILKRSLMSVVSALFLTGLLLVAAPTAHAFSSKKGAPDKSAPAADTAQTSEPAKPLKSIDDLVTSIEGVPYEKQALLNALKPQIEAPFKDVRVSEKKYGSSSTLEITFEMLAPKTKLSEISKDTGKWQIGPLLPDSGRCPLSASWAFAKSKKQVSCSLVAENCKAIQNVEVESEITCFFDHLDEKK